MPDGLEGDIAEFVRPVLAAFRGRFRATLQAHLVSVYVKGDAQVFEWGRTKVTDRPIYYEGPPMKDAMDYAKDRCAQLITKMEKETQQQIATVVKNGIENKRGIDGLARDIRAACRDMGYTPMGNYRAEMIARTETADALEQAFVDRSKKMGITGKEWIVHDPCDTCRANAALGVLPMDSEDYEDTEGNPIARPPAHPNCRCALAPVMLKGEE